MDIQMPVMGGFESTSRINDRLSSLFKSILALRRQLLYLACSVSLLHVANSFEVHGKLRVALAPRPLS